MFSFSDYRDRPGWFRAERDAMLTEARRRRAAPVAVLVLALAAAVAAFFGLPCPGHLGQY